MGKYRIVKFGKKVSHCQVEEGGHNQLRKIRLEKNHTPRLAEGLSCNSMEGCCRANPQPVGLVAVKVVLHGEQRIKRYVSRN